MTPIRSEDLERLVADAKRPAITIYMPTVKAGRETRQNGIRYRNLLRAVEAELDTRHDLDQATRTALLEPLTALSDDNEFWQHQDEGLVVFRDPEQFATHPLPVAPPEGAHVGRTFTIRHILPLIVEDGRFQVVVFGKEAVQLYVGTRHELREVILPEDCPTSLADALGRELTGPHLQHHSGRGPGKEAIWHGQGAGETKEDGEFYKYASMVGRTLSPALDPNAPIVLAGTEKPVATLREAAGWKGIVDGRIAGAPDTRELDRDKLHREGWALAEPIIMGRLNGDLGRIDGLEARGEATHDLEDAIAAVKQARVKSLYLTADAHQWGDYDGGRGRVRLDDERQRDSVDLVEMLARETWQQGGRVFHVDALPSGRKLQAVYRY